MIVEDEAFIFDGKAIERMFKNQSQKALGPPTLREKGDNFNKKAEKARKKVDDQEVFTVVLL